MNTKNFAPFALTLGLLCVGPSCYYFRSPVLYPPLVGTGFTGIGVPVDTTFRETEIGPKLGRSASHCMFGLFAWGDATVDTAARKGGIQVVDQIDANLVVVLLGCYSKYEIVVSGH